MNKCGMCVGVPRLPDLSKDKFKNSILIIASIGSLIHTKGA